MIDAPLLNVALVVLALSAIAVCAVALAASPRDPLLAEEVPWGCSRCDTAYPTLAEFLQHRCERATR
mgnify:CR=1 FL=1